MRAPMSIYASTCLFLLLIPVSAALSADAPVGAFQRAFYLEVHEGDFAAARELYQQIVEDPSVSTQVRQEAEDRLARCQEELLVPDLAQLAPADALAFVEIKGDQLAGIARALGLELDPAAGETPPRAIRIEDGLFLSEEFGISPALLREVSKIRAVTVAITRIDDRTGPHGVLVVDTGQSDLLRGLLETGVQFLRPDTSIEGYKTYRIENDAWLATTHRFVIVSRSREQLSQTIGRLANPEMDSLLKNAEFQRVRAERKNALVFAYIGGDTLRQTFDTLARKELGREADVVRNILDLDAWQSICLAVSVGNDQVSVDVELNLREGHHSLAYGLMRTPTLTGASLSNVPAGAAAVVGMGLNRSADVSSPSDEAGSHLPSVLDLGREIFDNMQDISLFVIPLEHGGITEIPADVGLIMTVKDAKKSIALWEAIAKLSEPVLGPSRQTSIGDIDTKVMQLPDGITVGFALLDPSTIVAGTEGAIAAVARARSTGETITGDPVIGSAFSSPDMQGNKMAVLQVGRLLQIAAMAEKGNDADQLVALSRILHNMTVSIVTDERPNVLTIRGRVTGLPKVEDVISELGELR